MQKAHTIVIQATQPQKATIIFLHGMSHQNKRWADEVQKYLAPKLPSVKWILPQAVDRYVTYEKESCPAWFDMAHLPPKSEEYDEAVIQESLSAIDEVIEEVKADASSGDKIALVGFSQGASTSMMYTLRAKHHLDAVVNLCGWIPPKAESGIIALTNRPFPPLLWCHGLADRKIPIAYRDSALVLTDKRGWSSENSQIDLREYAGLEHTTNEIEMNDVADWLDDVLFADGK